METRKLNEIEQLINKLRSHMILTARIKGLNHPDTIKCSQELDALLNEYSRLKFFHE